MIDELENEIEQVKTAFLEGANRIQSHEAFRNERDSYTGKKRGMPVYPRTLKAHWKVRDALEVCPG